MNSLGPLAQQVEQLTLNQPVTGSSPVRLTRNQLQNRSSEVAWQSDDPHLSRIGKSGNSKESQS